MSFLPISQTANTILLFLSAIGLVYSIYKWETIGSVAAGVIGGIALAEILRSLQKRCVYCGELNDNRRTHCRRCGGKQ